MSPLERRYRRLLLAYPQAHRHEYGEEMVGVLLQIAPPERRRPSLHDIAVLLRHAPAAHLRALRPALVAPDWARAGAIFGIVAALTLATRDLFGAATSTSDPFISTAGQLVTLGQAALWAAAGVGVALARHRRWPVALFIAVATVTEVATLTWWQPLGYFRTPAQSVARLAVAVAAGGGLLLGVRTERLPRPGWWIALGVLIALPTAAPLLHTVAPLDDRFPLPFAGGMGPRLATVLVLGGVVAPLGLFLFLRLAGPVRRRLLAILVALLAEAAFLFHTSEWHYDSLYAWYTGSGLVHWSDRLGAVAVPLGVFVLCALWVVRQDRIDQLVARGRQHVEVAG